jgi:O-antigen/teichoic acid export membrane protein
MNDRRGLLTNMLSSGVASWAEFFLGMLASIAIARSLLPDQYGHFTFMMWCATLFVIVSNGGLSTGAIKFVAEQDERGRNIILGHLARLQNYSLTITSLIAAASILLFPEFFLASAPLPAWALLLTASLFKASYIFWMSATQGRENFRRIARVVLIVAPSNLAANLLMAWLAPSLLNFVAVYLLTSLLYRLLIAPWRHASPTLPDTVTRKRVSRHLMITGASIVLSFFVLRQSEILFLRVFTSASDIAFFSIAYTIGFALAALIPGAYAALLLPMMSRQSSRSSLATSTYPRSLRYLMLLAAPMVVGTWLLGEHLILTLYGDAYRPAVVALLWVIAGVGISAISQAAVSLLVSQDQQGRVLQINLLVAVIVLAMDAALISQFGLYGAGPAFFFGCLLHSGLMVDTVRRLYQLTWPWRDSLRIAAAAILTALPTSLLLQLFPETTPPLWQMLAGALTYSALYLPASLLCGCWRGEEKLYIGDVSTRLPQPLAKIVKMLLR